MTVVKKKTKAGFRKEMTHVAPSVTIERINIFALIAVVEQGFYFCLFCREYLGKQLPSG